MADIKISELSIGDWVATPSAEGYIIDLYTSKKAGCIARLVHDDVQMVSEWECIHLEPIPITPEILEKNGFVNSSKYRWYNPSIGCACFRFGTKYWDIRINMRNRAYRPTRIRIDNILHIHQLQHALRLAGVEKEIEV
jgi:hypothetical protein